MKKIKALLIYPPFVSPEGGPYLSVPLLVGQLVANGIDAKGIDLNLDFNNYVLSKDYLLKTIEKLQLILKTSNNKEHIDLIESVIIKNKKLVDYVVENIDNAVSQIKKLENDNYTAKHEYSYIIENAFKIASVQYYPSSFLPSKEVMLNYEDIKKWSFNESENIYIEYFKNKIEDIKKENYDFIGVTIPACTQMPIAFTLLRLLKENTSAKILAGGNILYSIWENITKYPEIFELFCDDFIVGEGELAIVQYATYVEGKLSKKDVAGLLWKDENSEIIKNDEMLVKNVEDIKPAIYDVFELQNYFSKSISIPVQFSKGCYWHRCSFCTAYKGKPFYSIKTPKKAVDMLEDIVKKYNINDFTILDDAISPEFFEKFSDEILARGLKIKYSAFLRLERPYNYTLLEKLHRSGLWRAFWGYEAEAERIITLMNKGIDLENRKQIIKTSHEVGIVNAVGIIFGFPTETEEEMQQTLNFCFENAEYIDSFQPFVFELRKKSALLLDEEKYSLKNIQDKEEFSYFYDYDDVVSLDVKRKYQRAVVKLQKMKMMESNKNIAFHKKSSLLN